MSLRIGFVQSDGSIKDQEASVDDFINAMNFQVVKEIAGMLISEMSEDKIRNRMLRAGWAEDDEACQEAIGEAKDYIFTKFGIVR